MKYLLPALFVLAACAPDGSPIGSNERLALEYNVGESLMNDCNLRGQRCVEWLDFKREFEEGVDYLTTFEASLARWRIDNPRSPNPN